MVVKIEQHTVQQQLNSEIKMLEFLRSDGSYEQQDFMSGGGSEMSSQELSHTNYTHGVTGLYSPSHYFLHAQYHPPQYPKPYEAPHNPQGSHNPPGSGSPHHQANQQPNAQPNRQANPANGYGVNSEVRDNQNQTRNPGERGDYKDFNYKDFGLPQLDKKSENNHRYVNTTANSQETFPKQISPIANSVDVKLEEEEEPAGSAKESSSKPASKDKGEEVQVPSGDDKTESPPPSQKPSTGLTPDESQVRRHIDSFISDQKNHQRADTFSPEDNRSRHDSFYNNQSRYQVSPREEAEERPPSKDGSETGSSYRYGDLHIRSSISSDEGSNSQFNHREHRDSYSGRSSSLSPVSSSGHQGRSDSAPPTPNQYLSPGAYPGFPSTPTHSSTPNPHSSTPNHSPHKLPPGVSADNKDLFFCHLCSYVGTSKYHFNAHMDSHFEHRCPHCDYTSRTEGRLKRHMKDFHSDNPPDNFSGMKMIRQTGRPKMFKCKQCDYQTEVKVEFWEHSRSHIKEDKVLQCPKCPFVTEYKHHLEYHLRNHFGSKPFKCNKCNYACVNKSMLNSHMKSHTNVYQYRCADCTYATKYCHSLKLHLKKYNHKPATVLNPDGSLPTDGSGDFELVSKRGPPRGPRSMKRDKSPPPLPGNSVILPHRTIPGPPPPPPPMNGGLMAPFWPMMAAAQLGGQMNGMRPPPPPLIPVSGLPLGLGIPAEPSKMAASMLPSFLTGGSKTKCAMCDFTAENHLQLTQHMFQVHASAENQDLFNMYGIPADAIMEEAMRTAADAVSRVTGSTPNKPGTSSPLSGGSASPAAASRSAGSTPGPTLIPTPAWMKQEPEENVMVVTPQAPPTRNGEIPLDLTKPKSDFPFGPMSSMDFARVLKRPLSEDDTSPTPDADKSESTDNADAESSPTPRKRSRKGKAYKLDTICMKLQERYGPESPGHEGEGYVSDYNSEQGDSNHEDRPDRAPSAEQQISDSSKEDENEGNSSDISPPGIDYSKIHDSLRELNNGDKDHDSFYEHPEDILIPSENPEGDVAQALAEAQTKRRSSVGSSYGSASINRRKMFLMRHNDQQAAEAAASAAVVASARSLINSSPLGRPSSALSQSSPMAATSPVMPRVIAPIPTLQQDTVEEPPKGSVYECSRCAIMFRDCIMYTMHMGYHGYQDPFKCNMCGHQAKDRVEFFLHIARAAHE